MSEQKRQRAEAPRETAITKDALGAQDIVKSGETAAATMAARVTATVQARVVQAMQRPRVFDVVRERLMADCDRPRFAMMARYAKPQGWVTDEAGKYVLDEAGQKIRNYIVGWSIRFVEAAMQAMGNIEAETTSLYEDNGKKILRCSVVDIERNIPWSQEITVEKTVERKYLKSGQVPLGTRLNAYGDTLYLLPASADETRLAENRAVSMMIRTLGLRVVPGDLLDEAKERVERAREIAIAADAAGIAADPAKAKREFLDKMAKIGIKAADICEYLGGKSLDSASPEMVLELRIIGAGVVSGDLTWRDALAGSPYRENRDEKPEDEGGVKAREKIEASLASAKEKKKAVAPAQEGSAA